MASAAPATRNSTPAEAGAGLGGFACQHAAAADLERRDAGPPERAEEVAPPCPDALEQRAGQRGAVARGLHGLVIGPPLGLLRDAAGHHLGHRVEPLQGAQHGQQRRRAAGRRAGRGTARARARRAGRRRAAAARRACGDGDARPEESAAQQHGSVAAHGDDRRGGLAPGRAQLANDVARAGHPRAARRSISSAPRLSRRVRGVPRGVAQQDRQPQQREQRRRQPVRSGDAEPR